MAVNKTVNKSKFAPMQRGGLQLLQWRHARRLQLVYSACVYSLSTVLVFTVLLGLFTAFTAPVYSFHQLAPGTMPGKWWAQAWCMRKHSTTQAQVQLWHSPKHRPKHRWCMGASTGKCSHPFALVARLGGRGQAPAQHRVRNISNGSVNTD